MIATTIAAHQRASTPTADVQNNRVDATPPNDPLKPDAQMTKGLTCVPGDRPSIAPRRVTLVNPAVAAMSMLRGDGLSAGLPFVRPGVD